jgi:hypothetical protein
MWRIQVTRVEFKKFRIYADDSRICLVDSVELNLNE